MPYELADLRPAIRYLERYPEQSLMLMRSLRLGARPGFAVVVDDPDDVRAMLLVERPDWKRKSDQPSRIQVDALDPRSAIALLSWLPTVAHVRICSYRPWLQDLVRTVFRPDQTAHQVHCLAHHRQFRPSPQQSLVVEVGAKEHHLREQAIAMGSLERVERLFAIVQGEELVACAGLFPPDTEYVTVSGVYTRQQNRLQGFGSAVLSAATQAGIDSGKVVSYGLPVEDVPSLHLVAALGFTPACREWMVEGYPCH